MNLSDKQREIVESESKYSVIVAGAGSGKTRVIIEKIIKTLSKLQKGKKILALTFSNKAAQEMKDRLLEYLPQDQIEEKIFVGTIHNFCMEVVKRRSSAIGIFENLQIYEDENDRIKILIQALHSLPEFAENYFDENKKPKKSEVSQLMNRIVEKKKALLNYSDISDYEFKLIFREYSNIMINQNAIDFDDILYYAIKILSENSAIANLYQNIYPFIFVDEAQDLNYAQYESIKTISGKKSSIMMVGDPNQSIYGFNGSDSKYMMESFHSDFENVKKYELLENYRSAKKIVDAASIIERSFKMDVVYPINGEFKIIETTNESKEAEFVFKKIQFLLEKGHPDIENKIDYSDIIIIGRNRYIFNEIEFKLKNNNIPFNLKFSNLNNINYESDLFKVFILGLKAINNAKLGLHFKEVSSYLSSNKESDDIFNLKNIFPQKKEEYIFLKNLWNDAKKIDFKELNKKLNQYIEKIENEDEKFLTLKDFEIWDNICNQYVKQTNSTNRSLDGFITSVSLGVTNVINNEGITLSSVHMSKGLQFKIVFIIGVNEGTFPDYRANDESKLKEERHNFFVAITRAERLCYVSYVVKKSVPWGEKFVNPSMFISEIKNSVCL
ncbi:MAG: ATP-dependent helicase [Clostridia bacterium]|nr:ATP-dependent helicase [Clostridia bacterium]